MQPQRIARCVDGIVLLDKPLGISSNAALQRVKRLYRAEKAGHTGTLDPLATGLLPICLGEATKFAGMLLEAGKAYQATLRLGMRTVTGDAEGEVIERRPVAVGHNEVDTVLKRFQGEIRQIPPMYSALKHRGHPLYELARKGQTVERQPRSVHIYSIDLIEWQDPDVTIAVACSKGTYVRTLAEDVGAALGCGAHLAALRRTATGPFSLSQAKPMSAIEGMPEADRDKLLLPVDALLSSWPRSELTAQAAAQFVHGRAVATAVAPRLSGTAMVAVYADSGDFLGLGELDGKGLLHPKRLLRTGAALSSQPRPPSQKLSC